MPIHIHDWSDWSIWFDIKDDDGNVMGRKRYRYCLSTTCDEEDWDYE